MWIDYGRGVAWRGVAWRPQSNYAYEMIPHHNGSSRYYLFLLLAATLWDLQYHSYSYKEVG